jgi:hypothetical protein
MNQNSNILPQKKKPSFAQFMDEKEFDGEQPSSFLS